MTEVYEDDWLVRVRAQVMCRDEGTGGWLPLGGGGLSNVMVRKRPTHPAISSGVELNAAPLEVSNGGSPASSAAPQAPPTSHPLPPPTTTTSTPVPTPTPPHTTRGLLNTNNLYNNNQLGGSGGQLETAGLRAMDSSNSDNGNSERGSLLKFEYFIYGKRISDQSVVLSCTIKKDFQYNKVMPTFHHWVTDEKRFGLTFQTAADARAFDKGVRTAIEDLLDGLGGAWPSLQTYKQLNPAPKDDEDDHIFECLNLPSDSRSSSENSTASRSHQKRPVPLPPVTNPGVFHLQQDTRNIYKDTLNLSASARELLLKRKLAGSCSEEPPLFVGDPLNPDNYTYVQLAQGTLQRKDSGSSLKKRAQANLYPETYRAALKRDPKKPIMEGYHARLKCRHCQEWYIESTNKPGSCEYAPDCFRTCINGASCIQCAQCMLYHCMSDAEGDFATHPCACNTAEEGCTVRWIGLALLSLVVPCLWCYPPLKAVHLCCVACGISGGKHMPLQRPLHTYPHH